MTEEQVRQLIQQLCLEPDESEWLEFKASRYTADEMGEYISALANAAAVQERSHGYLVFGVEDGTRKIVGTTFRPKAEKIGNQMLEFWLNQMLNPKPHFNINEADIDGKHVVLFEITAAGNVPVAFKNQRYIRLSSCKTLLRHHPDKERLIFERFGEQDWSAESCPNASINDLDPAAVAYAREQYRIKNRSNPELLADEQNWDDLTFLNKARLTSSDGTLTRAALLLLGRPETASHLQPLVPRMTWILKDRDGIEQDYRHFDPPFITQVDALFHRVRNLTYRYLPDQTLFPEEVTQYDPWVMREALHNCIAHQNYRLCGRINVVEFPERLVFSNPGRFLPGSIEAVIDRDAPWERYQNPALAQAMVNLNMIDTIGSGIKRMFRKQMERFFPMPDYDFGQDGNVTATLHGRVMDERYTRMLRRMPEISLHTAMLLDRVQKDKPITKEEAKELRCSGLIEGRYPNLHVSAQIASATGQKADYIRNRGLDDAYYQRLILEFLGEYGSATRKDVDELLLSKLPDVLTEKQKKQRISHLLSHTLGTSLGLIENQGSRKASKWVLTKAGKEKLQVLRRRGI